MVVQLAASHGGLSFGEGGSGDTTPSVFGREESIVQLGLGS